MKKILMASVLAASMAISSSAFAAVSYGNGDTLGLEYLPLTNQLSLTDATQATLASTYAGKQLTIVVLNPDVNPDTIVASEIMYIDQAEAASDIFQNMGLLLAPDVTTLPIGTYDVKVGGEGISTLLVGQIIVSADGPTGTDVTFVWGDVNASTAVDGSDAVDILVKLAGGASTVGSSTYAIGQTLKDGIVWGDVNASTAVDGSDAVDILVKLAGGASTVGSSQYAIGDSVTINIPNAQ